MTGLIEEIQRDALGSDASIATLLRKVKLAAAKLGLDTIADWVESELNGYTGSLPSYRELRGIPRAFNPYNGWMPIHVDAKIYAEISKTRTAQSVAALENLLADGAETLSVPMSPGMVDALNKGRDFEWPQMAVFLNRSQIVAILDTVRNMVLDWAIEMERQGITGEGMSFSAQERQEARQVMANLTVGSIGSFVGNMGGGNTSRDISASGFSISQIWDVTSKIKEAIPDLRKVGVDADLLQKLLDAIEAEASTKAPDRGKLRGLLTDTRNALSGAAGNLTAAGALAGIDAILAALGMS